jgi:hypothetical protein
MDGLFDIQSRGLGGICNEVIRGIYMKTGSAIVAAALFLTLAGCPKKPDEAVTTVATEMPATDTPAMDMGTDGSTDVPTDSAS